MRAGRPVRCFPLALALVFAFPAAVAAPWVKPGDVALRHDLQRLADAGVIEGVMGTWPVPWQAIAEGLRASSDRALPAGLAASRRRVLAAVRGALLEDGSAVEFGVGVADERTLLRGYAAAPRAEREAMAAFENRSGRFAGRLEVTAVDDPPDDRAWRGDGSFASWQAGNWWLGAGAIDRWWGPGWDGSLILSNNARPVPGLFIERASAEAFETPWLSWLGPWRLSTFLGKLESDRFIPDAKLFGLRIVVRPFESLAIGLSRTAQLGGKGRPENLDTFLDMLAGDDNQGAGPDSDEPGNQLAGIDLRWNLAPLGQDAAAYAQLIGEDEAGNLPRGNMGLFGLETWSASGDGDSWRLFLEYADTTASFQADPPQFNAAYNHGIYQTGYRYRGRVIGHTADSDSQVWSLGGVFVSDDDHALDWVIRHGTLNRDDDGLSSVAPGALDIDSIRLGYSPPLERFDLYLRAGADRLQDDGRTVDDAHLSATLTHRF